jgi:hypothetical protein
MAIAAHHSYSPGLAPSDSYMFDHVKGVLRGESFETGEGLLSAIEDVLTSLRKVDFDQWFSRVDEEALAIYGDRW